MPEETRLGSPCHWPELREPYLTFTLRGLLEGKVPDGCRAGGLFSLRTFGLVAQGLSNYPCFLSSTGQEDRGPHARCLKVIVIILTEHK